MDTVRRKNIFYIRSFNVCVKTLLFLGGPIYVVFPYVGRKLHIHISASSHTRVHEIKYAYEYLNRLRLKKKTETLSKLVL